MATNDLRHAENRGRKAAKLAIAAFARQVPASALYAGGELRTLIEADAKHNRNVLLPVSDETWHAAIGIYRELLRFAAENVPSAEDDGDSMEELFEGRH
jgi:hypothetical protein